MHVCNFCLCLCTNIVYACDDFVYACDGFPLETVYACVRSCLCMCAISSMHVYNIVYACDEFGLLVTNRYKTGTLPKKNCLCRRRKKKRRMSTSLIPSGRLPMRKLCKFYPSTTPWRTQPRMTSSCVFLQWSFSTLLVSRISNTAR